MRYPPGDFWVRKVRGIDCRNLFANGGMIHCVTQQQLK
ncbi:agmatine deiminase family protein [Sphingobacterium sp.]